jgi:hypothetical protein
MEIYINTEAGNDQNTGLKAAPLWTTVLMSLSKKDGKVEIEEGLAKRNYLHLKQGTLGANLGAGLFTR